MRTLDFGKHKGQQLERCEESYVKWLSAHKNVLAERNQWASQEAKNLLEKPEYDISFEEYQEQHTWVSFSLDCGESDVEELEKEYPLYAQRAVREAEAKRGESWESYQARCASYKNELTMNELVYVED